MWPRGLASNWYGGSLIPPRQGEAPLATWALAKHLQPRNRILVYCKSHLVPSISGAPSYTNVAQPPLSRPFPLEIHWPPLSSSKHLGALSQGLWVERFLFLENPCINANFLALLVFFLSFLSTYFISIFIHLYLAVLGLHCCFGFL